MKNPYSILLSVVLVVCLGLVGGCKRSDSSSPASDKPKAAAGKPAVSAQEKKPLSPDELAEKKLAACADAYNQLVDKEHGMPDAYRTFTKKIPKVKASDNVPFPAVENLEKILESLRQARAEKTAGTDALDAAVEAFAAASEKLLALQKESGSHIKGKARAVLEKVQDDYESALKALSGLGVEVMAAKRAAIEKRMEKLKGAGDMVRYHTEEILMLSEELLALFDDPGVPFNRSEAFRKGNSIISKLDGAVLAHRKAVEDVRSKEGKVSPYYDTIRNNIGGIISDYREVRDKRSDTAFDAMLKRYDRAVQDYNSAQMKV